MYNTDSSRGTTPARISDLIPFSSSRPTRERDWSPPPEPPAGPGQKISARLVWGALRRHWWQALLVWTAGSAALIGFIYYKVRPTYDAFSTIKIDPGDRGLFRENNANVDFEVFKETQVQRITNPNVIATAISAHPELLQLPRLANARDVDVEIRKAVTVMMVPRTHLIQVSMSSENANEAAQIVNALIDAYLRVALDASEEETEKRAKRLREVKEERTKAVRQKREAISALVERLGMVDVRQVRDRNSVSVDAYSVLNTQLLQVDIDLIEAQAHLDQLRSASEAASDPAAIRDQVAAAFYNTPHVAELRGKLDKAQAAVEKAKRIARNHNDPAAREPQNQVDAIQRQIDALWVKMSPSLEKAEGSRGAELHAAEVKVVGLKTRLAGLDDRLKKLNVQTKAAGSDELTLEFAHQDLTRAEAVLDTVTRSLDQIEFDAKDPIARIRQEFKAKASNTANVNQRMRVMAAAPIGVLVGVIGLMVLVELHGGRVSDPDDLPGRTRLHVLGVVPPLPRPVGNPGLSKGRDEVRLRRDLDQFIQSLDHLRVAICSGRDSSGRSRRTILITSACSAEGKTTLAAQLAERCINAGLLTLLIDADIRNPTLSRMFDLPTSRGLVNVLRGESAAEEAISVIGGAGGFHFMPAGSPRVDPNALLQGDGMAKLLASARESFDIVLVDSPPVLPVPDALTIGRWVDGVVMAVRYDSSRYPLVDRAHRSLTTLGAPVIGAVINGVRKPESSYYGGYYPSYGSIDEVEDGAIIDS